MKKKLVFVLLMAAGIALFAEEKVFRYLLIQENPQYNTMTLAVFDADHDTGVDLDTSTPGTITARLNRKNARLIKNSILPNLESSWYGYTSYIYIGPEQDADAEIISEEEFEDYLDEAIRQAN